MKKYKILFLLNLILVLFSSCGSVNESFSSGKKENSDEFLVQKKSPLIMPPNYNELPEPTNNKTKNKNNKNEIKDLISKKKETYSNPKNTVDVDQTLQNTVLDKIKSN
jgi:hypothetical protein